MPAFFAHLPPNPLAGLPPHGTPLAELQQLEQNWDKMTDLLMNLLGNVEKMNARVGVDEPKVQGSLTQVGKNKHEIKALDARVRDLQLFHRHALGVCARQPQPQDH